jgi:predicted transcriptional regulator
LTEKKLLREVRVTERESIEKIDQLLYSLGESNWHEGNLPLHQLISKMEAIFSAPGTLELYMYFMKEHASTAQVIIEDFGIKESTLYKRLKRLQNIGLISKIVKVRDGSKKGGPHSTIYARHDYTPEDIQRASQKELQRSRVFFQISILAAQIILDDFVEKRGMTEISVRDVVIPVVKAQLRGGFRLGDIKDETCKILMEAGAKILY